MDSDRHPFSRCFFSGSFDGAGYRISNLYINSDADYVGFFGDVDSVDPDDPSKVVRISNVTLENFDITGNWWVGTLIGIGNCFVISNCSVVNGTVKGANNVGGLVGFGDGEIYFSSVDATVNGGDLVGGFAGEFIGYIHESYSTGSVSGSLSGGLVGNTFFGTDSPLFISNCYSLCDISGTTTGGLLGSHSGGTCFILNSYFAGTVISDNEYIGGIFGSLAQGKSPPLVTNCFYIEEFADGSNEYGIPISESDMKNMATFTVLDTAGGYIVETPWDISTEVFTQIWYILEGETYPQLSMSQLIVNENTDNGGDGTGNAFVRDPKPAAPAEPDVSFSEVAPLDPVTEIEEDVLPLPEEKKSLLNYWILFILLILVCLIGYWYYRKNKQNN